MHFAKSPMKYCLFIAQTLHASVIFLLILMASGQASALEIMNRHSVVNLNRGVQVLEDPTGRLTYEDVTRGDHQLKFAPAGSTGIHLNLGFSESTFWIKIPLRRAVNAPADWVVELPYQSLDHVEFFAPDKTPVHTGGLQPLDSRPLFHRYFAFPITLDVEEKNFYFRVSSAYSISVPLLLYERDAFLQSVQFEMLIQILYYGGLIALIIYNFMMFFALRDNSFLLYVLFAAAIGVAIFAGNGFARMYLWPNLVHWDQIAQITLFSLGAALSNLLACSFLKTQARTPRLDLILKITATIFVLIALVLMLSIYVSFSQTFLYQLMCLLIIPTAGLLIYVTINAIRAGHTEAYYFLLAFACVWIGACIAAMRAFGWVPTNTLTMYAVQIGSAFEMFFLSFALAFRVHIERNLKEKSQTEVIEARSKLLDILRASEERLEKTVKNRTHDLELLLANEKNLRQQYIRFGAMISHEFRNPLGTINIQLDLMRKDEAEGVFNLTKRISLMSSAAQRLGLLFEKWIQSDRLNYATNSVSTTEIDLQPWLREFIEKYRTYQPNHQFVLHLDPEISVLTADIQYLQILLLNLVDNACKYSAAGTVVQIETRRKPGMIGIAVKDQGIGIAAIHHQSIFNEYFRIDQSQSVHGVGLGLPFVKKIVALHQGTIEVESELSQGSTFCVWLPE
jgi:signal transduction histidine kinase